MDTNIGEGLAGRETLDLRTFMAGMAGISYVGGYGPGIGRNISCAVGDFG